MPVRCQQCAKSVVHVLGRAIAGSFTVGKGWKSTIRFHENLWRVWRCRLILDRNGSIAFYDLST